MKIYVNKITNTNVDPLGPPKYHTTLIAEIRSDDHADYILYTGATSSGTGPNPGIVSRNRFGPASSTTTPGSGTWTTAGTTSYNPKPLRTTYTSTYAQSSGTWESFVSRVWPYAYHMQLIGIGYTISSDVPLAELVNVDASSLGLKILALARSIL